MAVSASNAEGASAAVTMSAFSLSDQAAQTLIGGVSFLDVSSLLAASNAEGASAAVTLSAFSLSDQAAQTLIGGMVCGVRMACIYGLAHRFLVFF